MTLQPPSFFQSTLRQQKTATDGQKADKELGNLREQNVVLREELNAYKKMVSGLGNGSLPHQVPCLLTPASAGVPPLTSDLLHVEECLQSRVKLLEAEKKDISLNMFQLEKDLFEQKKRFSEERESLLEDHRNGINKLQCELGDLAVEYQEHKTAMSARVEELETQLHQAQQESHCHVQELQGKIAKLEQDNNTLQVEKLAEAERLSGELSGTRRQLEVSQDEAAKKLTNCQALVSSLEDEVRSGAQKVRELEAYLGGEVPDLDTGKTWKEERQLLGCHIERLEHDNQRLTSESKLLKIRLDSISKILSIQEEDITKRYGEEADAYQSLLACWREKVFVLLVQKKLQDIEVAQELEQFKIKERTFKDDLEECKRSCQLLSSSLSDKNAQLQLLSVQSKELEAALQQADRTVLELEEKLHMEHKYCAETRCKVDALVQVVSDFKSVFRRSLTQLFNYDQRLALLSGHVQSVTAALECRRVLSSVTPGAVSDAECQVGSGLSEVPEVGVVYLTRDQLEQELRTLRLERDQLITQLRGSSKSLREQLDKEATEKESLVEKLQELERHGSSLQASLEEKQGEVEVSKAHCQESSLKIRLLEEELRHAEATAEEKLECELVACRQRSREQLVEMEKLLAVARREHSKAVMDVQQLTRQLARDKDWAVQAAHMEEQQLQQELMATRKKLQETLVEKNLLLATLREEGITVPKKSRLLHVSFPNQQHQELSADSCAARATPPPVTGGNDAIRGLDRNGSQEDIRDVLKDLQVLSASLLSMEKEEADISAPKHKGTKS